MNIGSNMMRVTLSGALIRLSTKKADRNYVAF